MSTVDPAPPCATGSLLWLSLVTAGRFMSWSLRGLSSPMHSRRRSMTYFVSDVKMSCNCFTSTRCTIHVCSASLLSSSLICTSCQVLITGQVLGFGLWVWMRSLTSGGASRPAVLGMHARRRGRGVRARVLKVQELLLSVQFSSDSATARPQPVHSLEICLIRFYHSWRFSRLTPGLLISLLFLFPV
jgi:hypothetical protein